MKKSLTLAVVLAVAASCQQEKKAPPAADLGSSIASASPAAASVTAPPATRPAATATAPQARRDFSIERMRLVSTPDEIVTVLENGSVVIAKRVAGSPVLAVRGYVRAGGIYEGKWLGGGLSHLLEHLVAGGSSLHRSEAENRAILERIGNNSNAYTTTNHTAYFINTTPVHLSDAVDLLAGWLLQAAITPDEFNREREVVQRELEMGRGEPSRQFYYMAQMNRYRVSPVRVPVIGYQEVIQNLTRDDVYSYYKSAYQPNNIIFALAGDLDPEVMVKAMRGQLKSTAPGREFSHDIAAEPEVLTPRSLVATAPKIGDAKLLMEFPTIRLDHPDLYALDLLASALSEGEGSLLVRELRQRQHVVTSIDASSGTPEYVQGSFSISLQTSPNKLAAAREAVLKQLDEVKTHGIEADLLERAKTQMRVNLLRGRQTAADIAAGLASDYLTTGDPHFSDQYMQRILNTSAQDVQAVAKKYLDPSRLVATIMLPQEYAKDLPRAEDLVRAAASMPATAPSQATAVRRTTLPNGTILLVKRVPTSDLVSVKLFAAGGLTGEDAGSNGIGSFAMRCLSQGTTTRSDEQIAEAFDATGADFGTGCGNNTWFWSLTSTREGLEKDMAVFGDVIFNPTFPADKVDELRRRILAAIASQDADWTNQAMRFFRERYFGALAATPSPYRFQAIGTAENIKRLSADDLRNWYTQKILSSRRVLAIYGNLEEEQAQALAARYLGSGPNITHPEAPALPAAIASTRPAPKSPQVEVRGIEVQKTQQPLAGIVIGFDSGSMIGDPDYYSLTLADTLTSGYGFPTGYLHQVLRGQGLVYVVHGQNWPGRTTSTPGTFFVYAGCSPDKVNQVVDLILLNMGRLQGSDQDIQTAWFSRGQQLTITDEAMSNETVSEQAATAALDEVLGLGYAFREKFAPGIAAVSLADVRNIARRRLSSCVVTISTPAPELVKLASGVRHYESFPTVDLTPTGVSHAPAGGPAK